MKTHIPPLSNLSPTKIHKSPCQKSPTPRPLRIHLRAPDLFTGEQQNAETSPSIESPDKAEGVRGLNIARVIFLFDRRDRTERPPPAINVHSIALAAVFITGAINSSGGGGVSGHRGTAFRVSRAYTNLACTHRAIPSFPLYGRFSADSCVTRGISSVTEILHGRIHAPGIFTPESMRVTS